VRTSEFDVTWNVNELHMNDEPFVAAADASRTRILAVGDSHTAAIGASTFETWPKVLQRELNQKDPAQQFRVYNAGTIGYSLHQYVLRIMDQGPVVKPQYIVLGFGYASDLYDLLPPSHGGWAFFEPLPRTYFDFDESGHLVEKHWAPAPKSEAASAEPQRGRAAIRVRAFVNQFAIFRYLRRSNLSLYIGSRLRFGGESLWPNMEVLVEKEISPAYEYNWRLAEALLSKANEEAGRLGAKLIVLGIPYLPQVYDDVWNATFGGNPRFDREAGPRRLRAWCESNGIAYVESLDELRATVKAKGHWVHHRKDAHPTAEGQAAIARALLHSGLIVPRQPSP
jgi:lysophospholipase L1-like esterase